MASLVFATFPARRNKKRDADMAAFATNDQGRRRGPSAGATMCLTRLSKVTRANRDRSSVFQPRMWKNSSLEVGKHFSSDTSPADIRNLIDRVVISQATMRINLSEVAEENDGARILTFPWTRPSPYRKREITGSS